MRTICIPLVLTALSCTGCLTDSLSQYTLNQVQSGGNVRDELVMNCLAAVAADRNTLPSFAVFAAGNITVTDNASIQHGITYAPLKYTMEALTLSAYRSPKAQWTVDPIVEYEKLSALHAACLWALDGPAAAEVQHPGILGNQRDYLDQEPHFAVAERLSRVPQGWIQCGCKHDVPMDARFKGHQGKTWVWVTPEHSEEFSQFTLTLQDIATLDINNGYGLPLVITLTTYEVSKLPDASDKTKYVTIGLSENRMVKKEYRDLISSKIQESLKSGKEVNLTRAEWLAYTVPWLGTRTNPTTPNSVAGRTSTSQVNITGNGTTGAPGQNTVPGRVAQPATFDIK